MGQPRTREGSSPVFGELGNKACLSRRWGTLGRSGAATNGNTCTDKQVMNGACPEDGNLTVMSDRTTSSIAQTDGPPQIQNGTPRLRRRDRVSMRAGAGTDR